MKEAHSTIFLSILFLLNLYGSSAADETAVGTIHLPQGIEMKPCNNLIVRSIPGNFTTVLEIGRKYVEMLVNDTGSIEPFQGRWKWEPDRVLREPLRVYDLNDKMINECSTMKVFGDERKNYDEAKRFCFFGDQSLVAKDKNRRQLRGRQLSETNQQSAPCTAYSIGSNNKWDFEIDFHHSTNCAMETFDCTCNVTIPDEIKNRTRFWHSCVGVKDSADKEFLTFKSLNKLVGRNEGPDYLKVDIEGYEWAVLRGMADQVMKDPSLHRHLPLQIYGEFHLDRESDENNVYHQLNGGNAYVGKKLRNFFDDLFIKAGYLIMHRRVTLQTRNTDILLTKLFCPANDVESLSESQL